MLAVSIGLVLAMLVARTSVNAKVDEIKASTATNITINPAGMMGGMGSGNALTADEVKKVASTPHIANVTSTLTDQLGTDDTNLTPSLELGSLGKRMQRFESGDGGNAPMIHIEAGSGSGAKTFTPRTSVTGTTAPASIAPSDTLTDGSMIDGSSSDLVALVGKDLATKNSLSVGSTFTAYSKTITVKGVYSTGNKFQDSSIIMPLATVQTLTNQAGAISSIAAKVDSSDNVAGTVADLKSALGDKADITSEQEQAQNSVKALESIAGLALTGVIGAAATGAVIILLAMVMIVRERRREIGVIKAIGGTNAKVIGQFVTEALTLSIVGGIIGLGLGVAVSGPVTQSLVSGTDSPQMQRGPGQVGQRGGGLFQKASSQLGKNLKSVTTTVTPDVFASGVGIMLLIAIIGSALPAWSIARVRPAEVLRTE